MNDQSYYNIVLNNIDGRFVYDDYRLKELLNYTHKLVKMNIRLICDEYYYQKCYYIVKQLKLKRIKVVQYNLPDLQNIRISEMNIREFMYNYLPSAIRLYACTLGDNQIIGRCLDVDRIYSKCYEYFQLGLSYINKQKLNLQFVQLIRLDFYFWFTFQEKQLTNIKLSISPYNILLPLSTWPGMYYFQNKLEINDIQEDIQKHLYLNNQEHPYKFNNTQNILFNDYIDYNYLRKIYYYSNIGYICLYDLSILLLTLTAHIENFTSSQQFQLFITNIELQYLEQIKKELIQYDIFRKLLQQTLVHYNAAHQNFEHLDTLQYKNHQTTRYQYPRFIQYIYNTCNIKQEYTQRDQLMNQYILQTYAFQIIKEIQKHIPKKFKQLHQYINKKVSKKLIFQLFVYIIEGGKLVRVDTILAKQLKKPK